MLAPDTETPEVTQTTVGTDLLQALKVITELRVNTVGQDLRVLAVDDVPLPVQEPRGDLELSRVLDDGNETLELIRVQLAGAESSLSKRQVLHEGVWDAPLVQVDIGLFADKVGVTTTNTLDLGQGVHDLALAINVSVEETQDVLNHRFSPRPFSCFEDWKRTWNWMWASGTTRDMMGGGGVT